MIGAPQRGAEMPTLDSLGAAMLAPDELASLALYLRQLAGWLEELRFLDPSHIHQMHDSVVSELRAATAISGRMLVRGAHR